MRKFYIVVGFLFVATYAWADFTGRELSRTRRRVVAGQSIRGATVGATSYWYRGYRGGK